MNPDSKVHGANMGPAWILSAPDGPHIGPMSLALREVSIGAQIAGKPLWELILDWIIETHMNCSLEYRMNFDFIIYYVSNLYSN